MVLNFIIRSPEVYRVDFVSSLNDKYLRMGGFANADHSTLNGADDFYVTFSHYDIEENSKWNDAEPFEGILSLELHLYDNDTEEIACIDNVDMPVKTPTVIHLTIKHDTEGNFICEIN